MANTVCLWDNVITLQTTGGCVDHNAGELVFLNWGKLLKNTNAEIPIYYLQAIDFLVS